MEVQARGQIGAALLQLQQCGIWAVSSTYTTDHSNAGSFNPPNEARDQTLILMDVSWINFCFATVGTPNVRHSYLFYVDETLTWNKLRFYDPRAKSQRRVQWVIGCIALIPLQEKKGHPPPAIGSSAGCQFLQGLSHLKSSSCARSCLCFGTGPIQWLIVWGIKFWPSTCNLVQLWIVINYDFY